jgi:hypothetical protein
VVKGRRWEIDQSARRIGTETGKDWKLVDEFSEDGALIFTTETREAMLGRVCLLVVLNGIAIAWTVVSYFGPRPQDLQMVGLLVAMDGFFLTMSVVMPWLGPRGTWSISLRGVAFHPCYRAIRWLAWPDIEQVQ